MTNYIEKKILTGLVKNIIKTIFLAKLKSCSFEKCFKQNICLKNISMGPLKARMLKCQVQWTQLSAVSEDLNACNITQ